MPGLSRVNKDVFDPSDFLPEQLVFFGQVLVLDHLQLQALLIALFLPVQLSLVDALLFVPSPLHLSFDFFKLGLHLIAVAFVLPLQPRVLIFLDGQLGLGLFESLALLECLGSELIKFLFQQEHLLPH